MAFLACEAPTAALDKLAFQGLSTGPRKSVKQEPWPNAGDAVLKLGGGQAHPSSVKL